MCLSSHKRAHEQRKERVASEKGICSFSFPPDTSVFNLPVKQHNRNSGSSFLSEAVLCERPYVSLCVCERLCMSVFRSVSLVEEKVITAAFALLPLILHLHAAH
jgi:hypothetical protein